MKFDLFINFAISELKMLKFIEHFFRGDPESMDHRTHEQYYCLNKNINNKYINKILIPTFSEKSFRLLSKACQVENWKEKIEFLDLKTSNDILIPENGTFWNFSEISKTYLNNGGENILIISNSDIEFNESLKISEIFNFDNTAICLSAWNVENFSSTFIHPKPFQEACSSQDCWIFKPTKKIKNIKVPIGTHLCESRIANNLERIGLKTVNPSYSIITKHIHRNHQPKATHNRFLPTFEKAVQENPETISRILDNTSLVPPVCISLTQEYNSCFRSGHHGIRGHSFSLK